MWKKGLLWASTALHRYHKPWAHQPTSISPRFSVHYRNGEIAERIRHCLSVLASMWLRYGRANYRAPTSNFHRDILVANHFSLSANYWYLGRFLSLASSVLSSQVAVISLSINIFGDVDRWLSLGDIIIKCFTQILISIRIKIRVSSE